MPRVDGLEAKDRYIKYPYSERRLVGVCLGLSAEEPSML